MGHASPPTMGHPAAGVLGCGGIFSGHFSAYAAVPICFASTSHARSLGPAVPASAMPPEFERVAQALPPAVGDVGTILSRLLLAAILGAAISFRGTRRSGFQVVHTNMILAF